MPSPSSPSRPNPSSSDSESSSEPQTQAGEAGEPDSGQTSSERIKEAEEPANAGSQLEEIGKAMERAGTSERQEASDSSATGDDPWDPLMPEPEPSQAPSSDSLEAASAPALSSDISTAPSGDLDNQDSTPDPEMQGPGGAPTDETDGPYDEGPDAVDAGEAVNPNGTPQPPTEIAGGADGRSGDFENTDASGSPASNSGLDEAAGAALEDLARALEQAGIALQSAGATLSENGSGEFDEDTEAAMTDANIAVLVAEQALEAAIASTDNPTAGMTAEISDAARLIILANRVLSEAQGSPNDGRLADDTMILGAPSGTDRLGELDAELEASIAIFESEIQGSRDAVASILSGPAAEAVGGPGPSLDDIATGMTEPEGSLEDSETGLNQDELESEQQQGRMIDGENTDSAQGSPPIPEDIPSPQGDDIVAKQLREAASAEKDPELRAKLWEEYKRYKEGL